MKNTKDSPEKHLQGNKLSLPEIPDQQRRDPSLSTYVYSYEEPEDSLIDEPSPFYGMQEDDAVHTLADYYALPDNRRVELIDGRFYEMTAPRTVHQAILSSLTYRFESYRRTSKNKRDCHVFPAPFDVQLDRDDYTMVEPDISIICDKNKIREFGCFGAPDLVVEILSLSTRTRDMYMVNKNIKHVQIH